MVDLWKLILVLCIVICSSYAQQGPSNQNVPPRPPADTRFRQSSDIDDDISNYGDDPNLSFEDFRKLRLYPFGRADLKEIKQSSPLVEVALTFRLPFFGFAYSYVWVQRDGYILFNKGKLEYKFPVEFPSKTLDFNRGEEDPSFIAPWFSQQNIAADVLDSGVYIREVKLEGHHEDRLVKRILLDFTTGMIGAVNFKPTQALIVTWKNVTMTGMRSDKPLLTNTYQLVLATDEIRTYVMFNYDKISWITHEDAQYGRTGHPAFVGFNAGNRTRAWEFHPYSQTPRLTLLTEGGYGNGIPGRYYFQIDEEIWTGSCLRRELDPNWKDRPRLTFFPRYGNMLGGVLVNVTGPCFDNKNDLITCRFDTRTTVGVYQDINHVTCISPAVMYHGYVDISISINEGSYFFLGRYYVQPPEFAKEGIKTPDRFTEEGVDPDRLTISWTGKDLAWNTRASIGVHLWGYREIAENYPKLTHITKLVEDGALTLSKERHTFETEEFKDEWDSDLLDLTFGFISINLTNPESVYGKGIRESPLLWSRPLPLEWYFRPQWKKKFGNWKKHFCEEWYYKEKYADLFAQTVFRCPCIYKQAELDRGRFSPDSHCNSNDKKCQFFFGYAQHCVRTGRPAIGGAGQVCCYDDAGELMRTADSMFAGRPSRAFAYGKHPFKHRTMIPTLSHWLYDVMPFYFCCRSSTGKEDADTCAMFKYWRNSQDCTLYQSSGVASVFGDPHLITFDGTNYTFNGKGEFSLVHVANPMHKLDVHGRFEEMPRKSILNKRIDATQLTSVAVMVNNSAIVEIRLRPPASRWRYHLDVIVDKEYVFFWDDTLRIQNFKGVTIYLPTGTWNVSHVVVMFDSGAGIEVITSKDHMSLHVYLPITYMNKTAGLLGNWSGLLEDDFTLPNGVTTSYYTTPRDIYSKFGKMWRLTEMDQPGLGRSLHFHDAIPYSEYDDSEYIPDFRNPLIVPPEFNYSQFHVNRICSDSYACKYDFLLTGDEHYASTTYKRDTKARQMASDISAEVIRCPEIPRPQHGRKSDLRYHVGIVVRFACDTGYRLVGYEYRKCRSSGLWTWGIEAECISDAFYVRKIAGISVGIIVPLILILICIGGCIMFRRRKTRVHYTGEKGLPPRAYMTEIVGEENDKLKEKNVETEA